jgi:hypothetical protein
MIDFKLKKNGFVCFIKSADISKNFKNTLNKKKILLEYPSIY